MSTNAMDHLSDHNVLHTQHNALETAGRGVVATASRTTNFVLQSGSLGDVTSLSITFTTVANRRYRCSANFGVYHWNPTDPPYPALIEVALLFDGTQVDRDWNMSNPFYLSNADKCYLEHVTLTAPTAASHTWKVQGRYTDATQASEITASTARPAYIILEDIGA